MAIYISGIQQLGIGVPDAEKMFHYYRKAFGQDVRAFDDAAPAPLMTRYTGDEVFVRRAILSVNLNGGGGFEIWQCTSRTANKADWELQVGDLGIGLAKIKSFAIDLSHARHVESGYQVSDIFSNPSGQRHYYFQDEEGNRFNVIEHDIDRFSAASDHGTTGGVGGAVIGVSDMDKSIEFYKHILGYDEVLCDETGTFDDLATLPGGKREVRRVILNMSKPTQGPFSQVFGRSQVELIQLTQDKGRKIFENRYWGDLGFIHLCYDVQGMDELKEKCAAAGHPFTVDSGETFDMGEAGGRFSYIEDPDGTLIEFVETHNMTLLKKPKIALNLKKRKPGKPIPKFILQGLRFSRVKG